MTHVNPEVIGPHPQGGVTRDHPVGLRAGFTKDIGLASEGERAFLVAKGVHRIQGH